jgi:uncharacterized protein
MSFIIPLFIKETATSKVKAAQDAWNICNPERLAQAHTIDSRLHNTIDFLMAEKQL